MHSYVANSETVRDSCLDDIKDCDLYILLVGHRYGLQPTQDNPDKLSITQLEFRHAGELKLPRLAFLRTSVPDISLSDLDDPERGRLVHAFRNEVAEALRPAEFKDMQDLVAAFSSAILHRVMKLLKERDADAARGEQRVAELDAELEKVREGAVSRVLTTVGQPDAEGLARQAREALLKGDTVLAEQLLRRQEDQAAAAAVTKRHEAADLAREIAALAVGRDSPTALAALERAARYEPEDFWTLIQLGDAQVVLGQTLASLASYRGAQAIAEAVTAQTPVDTSEYDSAQRDLSVSHNRIGDVLVAQGDGPGALAAYRKGLAIREALAARDPANAEWQRDLIVSNVKLGEATGDKSYAHRALEIAEDMRRRNVLAPRDAWLIDELKRRAAE